MCALRDKLQKVCIEKVRFFKENGQFLDENGLSPPNYDTFLSRECGYLLKIANHNKLPNLLVATKLKNRQKNEENGGF